MLVAGDVRGFTACASHSTLGHAAASSGKHAGKCATRSSALPCPLLLARQRTLLLFTATRSSSDSASPVMGSVPVSCRRHRRDFRRQ